MWTPVAMQVFVRTPGGATLTLQCEEPGRTSVRQLKQRAVRRAAETERLPEPPFSLSRRGRQLSPQEEMQTLSGCGIVDETEFDLVSAAPTAAPGLKGGASRDYELRGIEDQRLTDRPSESLFRSAYAQHHYFGSQTRDLEVHGKQQFNETVWVDLDKARPGEAQWDAIGAVTWVFTVPAIRHHSEPCRGADAVAPVKKQKQPHKRKKSGKAAELTTEVSLLEREQKAKASASYATARSELMSHDPEKGEQEEEEEEEDNDTSTTTRRSCSSSSASTGSDDEIAKPNRRGHRKTRTKQHRRQKRTDDTSTTTTTTATAVTDETTETTTSSDKTQGDSSSSDGDGVVHRKQRAKQKNRRGGLRLEKDGLPRQYVTWKNALGNWIWSTQSHLIGGEELHPHPHTPDFYEAVKDEFTVKEGQRNDSAVGRFRDEVELWEAGRKKQRVYCRARFPFCEHVSKALKVCALQTCSNSLRMRTQDLRDCVYSSDGSMPMLLEEDRELRPSDLKIRCRAKVYYLSPAERRDTLNTDHEEFITDVQYNGGQAVSGERIRQGVPIQVPLPFKHAVRSLFWVVQRKKNVQRGDHITWSGPRNTDPVIAYRFVTPSRVVTGANGQPQQQWDEYEPWKEGVWAREIEPLEGHWSSKPLRHVYNKNWAVYAEDGQITSGTKNFTEQPLVLELLLEPSLGECMIKVWAISEQVFVIRRTKRGGEARVMWK